MNPPQPPLPLSPPPAHTPTSSTSERPRTTGATAVTSIRMPAVMKAASLDLCDRMPHRFQCANDVYVTAIRDFLQHEATEDTASEKLLAALAPCRLVLEFERAQQTTLEGIERTREMVQAAVARGMTERAHEVYGAQMEHFRTCGDKDWSAEGVRLLEATVKPLLPKRNPLNLRIVAKAVDNQR